MAKEIKIFDPRDKPFGCLSNNYSNYLKGEKQSVPVIQSLKFGTGKPCKTLTNYIYASLIDNESLKNIICSAKSKDVKKLFNEQVKNEKEQIIKNAVQEGLKSMFEENTDLAKLLLSTGTGKIFYISKNDDKFLGIDEHGNGNNLYGVLLEQERTRLLAELRKQERQQDKENEQNIMYDTYLAQKVLIDAINGGDNLKKYIDRSLTSTQIVQEFGRETLESKSLSREQFLNSFPTKISANVVSYVRDPKNMVYLIRKQFLPKLRDKRLREKKKQIFYMYADYLLKKKGVKPEDYEKAKEQQFSGKEFFNQADNLEDRLYDLYNKGMLSESLSQAIDKRFNAYYIPTDEEIAYTNEPPDKKAVFKQQSEYVSSNTKPIYILPSDAKSDERYKENSYYVVFSPDNICKNIIKINGFTYLTLNHYIIEKLMLRLGVKDVHSYILNSTTGGFRNLPDIVKDYEKFKIKYYKEKLIFYTKKGLNQKFENLVMQDYLLATGNSKLVYNDFDDDILGIGSDSNGDNEVGKYLMELRTKLAEKRKDDDFKTLTSGDITFIINKNAFMKDWVIQRVKDSCRTIVTMNDYVEEKFKTKDILSPKFVTAVLDNIYHPCSQIYGAVDRIKDLEIPEYFVNIVKECDNMESASLKIIDLLWKRIAVIIYYLIIHLEKKGVKITDISSEIGQVQVLKSETIVCEKIVLDQYENCIIVALVNLIIGIIDFNIQNSGQKIEVTNLEVQAAASIILESIIPKKSSKEDEEEIIEGLKDPKDGKEVGEDLTSYQDEDEIDKLIDEAIIDNEDSLKFEFTDEELEGESGEEELGYESEKSDKSNFSPESDKNKIIVYLKEFSVIETKNIDKLATYIKDAVTIIKDETKQIPAQIKRNRVNFFAGHK